MISTATSGFSPSLSIKYKAGNTASYVSLNSVKDIPIEYHIHHCSINTRCSGVQFTHTTSNPLVTALFPTSLYHSPPSDPTISTSNVRHNTALTRKIDFMIFQTRNHQVWKFFLYLYYMITKVI